MVDETIDETSGGINHLSCLNLSKIFISNNCATKKATPDAVAILIDIKFNACNEKKVDITIPVKKPKYTTFLAVVLPYFLFVKSVIKKAIG